MDQLNGYESLNPIEQLFAKDDLDTVKQYDIDFGPRFSEICAFYSADKCLRYLIDEGYELSPVVNLFRIKRGESPIPEVSHDDELYFVLVYGRDEMLPFDLEELQVIQETSRTFEGCESACYEASRQGRIDRPSIHVAFRTLMKLLKNHAFDMVDYASKVYSLYLPREWSEFVGQCWGKQVEMVIRYKLYFLLSGARLSYRAIKVVRKISSRKRRLISQYCSLPILYRRC